jgi:hypothetical protein
VAALDAPLPGVSLPATLPDHVEPGKTKITTLPNGVKIASETSPVRLLFFFFLGELYVRLALPSHDYFTQFIVSNCVLKSLMLLEKTVGLGGDLLSSMRKWMQIFWTGWDMN